MPLTLRPNVLPLPRYGLPLSLRVAYVRFVSCDAQGECPQSAYDTTTHPRVGFNGLGIGNCQEEERDYVANFYREHKNTVVSPCRFGSRVSNLPAKKEVILIHRDGRPPTAPSRAIYTMVVAVCLGLFAPKRKKSHESKPWP